VREFARRHKFGKGVHKISQSWQRNIKHLSFLLLHTVWCETLTSGDLGSHPLGTTSTGACSPGVCGGADDVPLGDAQAQWASCPKTLQEVTPTCRVGVAVTCR
jgi:hypothetical protein